jgi:cyclopropane fatty-acyl-phospholipid synthase-like methyltransferase
VAEKEGVVDLYGASYGGFASDLYGEVRREAWGEEIGQNSWLTRDELERFSSQLKLENSSHLLEVGCGSGGPALHLARLTSCEVVGVDLHEDGVANASRMAREAGLDARSGFVRADASETLPFERESFDALLCIDTVNHLRDRPRVFRDWVRLLAPGGRVLFTDPITVTGPLGSDEIAIRASIAYFVFVPPGEDERLLREAGLRVLAVEDATENMATVAGRWLAARAKRADALREIEGDQTFQGQQRFLEVTARLARERRLSRFVYLAEKPS